MIRSKILKFAQFHWNLYFLLITSIMVFFNLLIIDIHATVHVLYSEIINMLRIEKMKEFDIGLIEINFLFFRQILESSIRVDQILIVVAYLIEICCKHRNNHYVYEHSHQASCERLEVIVFFKVEVYRVPKYINILYKCFKSKHVTYI